MIKLNKIHVKYGEILKYRNTNKFTHKNNMKQYLYICFVGCVNICSKKNEIKMFYF